MDVVETLPVFTPQGLTADGYDSRTSPPRTRVVMVPGLMGPKPDDLIRWSQHWIPPDSSMECLDPYFSPSSIVGEDFSERLLKTKAKKLLEWLRIDAGDSYVFWAEDIGGAIVKLALAIAARKAKYRRILDTTQAVVFFGTPHRASSKYSLDSTILAVIEACYHGLLGNWLPAMVNRLSRQLEDIHEMFSPISHHFSIISHYQKPSSSVLYQVIVTEDCATLGLENEVVIGCDRPHKDMADLMSRQEQFMLQMHMINIKFEHWDRFKHFLGILKSICGKRELEGPVSPLPRSTKVMARCSRDSKLVEWISSENAPKYMKVALGTTVDPSKLLNSVAGAMRKIPQALWAACPSVDLGYTGECLGDKARIYAGLLQQVLTQQPRAFSHMHHLVPVLTDAINGHMEGWKERALWLCLRTVIHASLGIPTYGFLHVKTPASHTVLQQITSAWRETDSRFRLVLAFTENLPVYLHNFEYIDLDFESGDLEDCDLVDTILPFKASVTLTGELDNASLDSIEERVQYSTTTKDTILQFLALQIQTLGRLTYIALIWIAFATRPLSMDELDLVLDFDDKSDSGIVSTLADFPRGSASRLPRLLPDNIVSIKLGRVFLRVPYADMRHILTQLSHIYLAPGLSPHLYIAQSCVTILMKHILKAAERGGPDSDVEDTESETDDSRDESRDDSIDDSSDDSDSPSDAKMTDGLLPGRDEVQSPLQVEAQQWAVNTMSDSQWILAEYTARNWMVHYQLARVDADLEHDKPYSVFIGEEAHVQSWLCLVEYLACLPPRSIGHLSSVPNRLLQNHFDTTKFKDLEILYHMASRPSVVSGLGRLLIYAAEVGNKAIIHLLLAELDLIPEPAVLRALASTSGSIYNDLWKGAGPFLEEQNPHILAQVHLTAQVLGNDVTSTILRAQLLSSATSPEREQWFSDALHQSIVYCDDDAIDELLNCNDLKECINSSDKPRWTAIHRAADHGSLQVVTRLWGAGLTHAINVLSPDQQSPLFIASSHGFADIVEFLINNGARVDDINGRLGRTALHIASHHGHLRSTLIILNGHASITASDTEGDFALHLAIREGHIRLAELLVERFPDLPAASQPMETDEGISLRPSLSPTPAPEPSDMWTEITKDLIVREAIEVAGYDYEETASYYYIRQYLRYEDVIDLVESSDQIRARTRSRVLSGTGSPMDVDANSVPLNSANMFGVNALFSAADRDLPTVCRCLLERGADPNILGNQSRVTLHMAAKAGSVGLIKDLLDKGTVTNHVSEEFSAIPLHYACYRGLSDAVRALMDKSDLSSKDFWGRTPLSAACAAGHLQAVKVLLGYYDKKDWVQGLISASRYGHQDVTMYLLDMGCPISDIGADGETAIFGAATSNHPRILQLLLLRGANPALGKRDTEPAIHCVSREGSLESARLLIEAGIQLDVEYNSDTPLGLAIYYEHVAIVRLLLERGARMRLPRCWDRYSCLLDFSWGLSIIPITRILLDYYLKGKHEDGLTPAKALIVAMERRNKTFLRLVLEKWFTSADTAANLSASEALHYAVSKGYRKYLKVILQNPAAKASINEQQPELGTPLHAAIGTDRNSREMVELLLDHDADAQIVAGRFGTTINAACVAAKFDIGKRLLGILPRAELDSITGKYGTPIQSAVVGFQAEPSEITIEMLDLLEEYGCSVNTTGGFYSTAFHAAVFLSTPEVIAWFMRKGRDLALQADDAGRLPLQLAIFRGDWDIINDVIDGTNSRRSPWWTTDFQLRTCLHYAAVSTVATVVDKILSQLDSMYEARLLVNSKDIDGWTPLHWACRQPKKEIVAMLLAKGADPNALTNEAWAPRHIAVLHHNNDEDYLKLLPDKGDVGERLPDGEILSFDKRCDICFVDMCWKYYHCISKECDDFNLCFKCYGHAEDIHNDRHAFHMYNE